MINENMDKSCDELGDCTYCPFADTEFSCYIAYKTHNTFQDIIDALENEIEKVKEKLKK